MLSPQDLLLIGAVGFILFGSKKLPEMAKSLGSSVVEFKKAMNEALDGGEATAAKEPEKTAAAAEKVPAEKA